MATWPNRVDYRLPEAAAKEIEFLADNSAHLTSIIECSMVQAFGSSFEQIISPIAQKVSLPLQDVRRIFNSLENIRDLQDDLGSAESVLGRIMSAVNPDISDKLRRNLLPIIHAANMYSRDNPVAVTLKAQRLIYARERLFHDAEIITDARPIFDTAGNNILEFVITHTMMTSTQVDGEFQQRYVSLDNADVFHLREACDRAIVKAQALKRALSPISSAVIVRDDTDDISGHDAEG